MKMLWCWRCKAELPMLTDEEFAQVLAKSPMQLQRPGEKWNWQPLLAEFESITGLKTTNPNFVYHHVLSLYGPPCAACGKPLRSRRAKLCGACMAPVAQ